MMSDESIYRINIASPSSSPITTEPIVRIPSFPPTTTTVDGSASAGGGGGDTPTPDQAATPAAGQEGGRSDVCLRISCQVLHRICTIVTYPFMVLFTLVSLILLTFFCIFPTLLCLTFGTCLYYCLMEDPIPLSVLLRYMLSPDADDTSPTSLYPMSQQRPVIQSKLIVRKLLRIDDIIGSSETSSSEYPRKHPFPIHLSTESKCLYFSEPLDAEEDNDDGNNNSISNSNSNCDTFRIVVVGEEEENINEPSSITMENQRPDTHGISGITDTTSDHMTSLNEGDDEDAKEEEEPPPKSEVGSTTTEPLSQNQPVPKSETKDNDNPNNDMVEIDIGDQMVVETVDEKSLSSKDDNDPSNEKNVEGRAEEGTIMLNAGVDDDKKQDADEQKLVDTTMEKGDKQQQQEEEEEEATATKTKKEEEDYFGIYESRDRGTSCDICLLEYQVGDIIAWSPNLECTHTFHRDCVLDWLVRKPTCPICRHDYLKGKNDESV